MSTITTVLLQDEHVPSHHKAQLKHKTSQKNQKHHHEDYHYRDTEDLTTEINEFFSYEETRQLLDEHHLQDWRSRSLKEQEETINMILNTLRKRKNRGNKSLLQQEQINAAKHLICILLCPDRTVQHLIHAVRLVTDSGGFDLLCRRLKKMMKKISAFENQATPGMIEEFELYLTLTYLMVECRRQESSDQPLGVIDTSFVAFLFSFLGQINDHNVHVLPVRKLILLVWKSMLVIFGSLTTLQQTRSAQSDIKSTLQDYYKFIEETAEKYPSYQPCTISNLPPPSTVRATPSSISAMGLARASSQIDLPYQAYCKHTTSTTKNRGVSSPPTSHVPYSIIEAGQLYLDHLYPSMAHRQIIEQREQLIYQQPSPEPDLNRFERFYKSIVLDLQSVMVFLLKQLLNSLTPSDDIDTSRSNQIQCKSISAILLFFLKRAKSSHVLKFEYVCQVLVDSGAILLLLKLFGLQDMASLAGCPSEMEDSSLYPVTNYPTNRRNMFWMINLMRVLQKLTKGKSNRVMILVQYKSTSLFKKILKISHPVLELYTLKVLKSQVPYQTRKWRANNMKIISAIYLQCRTSLYDDWMSKVEVDDALIQGKAEEINIRLLARIYHGEVYNLPDWLPSFDHDEVLQEEEEDELELDPSFVANYEIWLDDENNQVEDKTEDEQISIQQTNETIQSEDDQVEQTVEMIQTEVKQADETELVIEQTDETDTIQQLLELEDDVIELLEEEEEDDEISTPEDLTIHILDLNLDQEIGTPVPSGDMNDYFYYPKHTSEQDEKNDWVDPTTAMDCRAVRLHHRQHQQRHAWSHSI
ncbi:hypothetical protein BC941DRAFT_475464 [Chlamydoabsidia padenii]|nr:hypothetical protein BC941DRAFT_475464 [Chlamydoabsidia padenii]